MTDLEVQAEYFGIAIDRWNNASYAISTANADASLASDIPELWPDRGALNDAVRQINLLATTIQENLLSDGMIKVMSIATTLRQVGLNYVVCEAQNEEEARKLEAML